MTRSRRVRAVALAGFLTCALGVPSAQASNAAEAGWGIGAALTSVFYAPLKVFYAAAGATFGGIGFGLSGGDPEVVRTVITPAVRGDYVVTPAHLRGERRLEFVGLARERDEPAPTQIGLDDRFDPYRDAYFDE